LWPMDAQLTGETSVIVSEVDHNVSLFRKEASELERTGGFHYGELANKFILGAIALVAPEAQIKPEMLIVSATGRISVVSQVDEDTSIHFTSLQRNLGYVKQGPGGKDLTSYRTPKNPRGPRPFAGFIDGDFVERFLDLSDEEVKLVMSGRNEFERLHGTQEDVLQLVEQITALH